MTFPGGTPPMRPDQSLQPRSRAGVGPAPQNNIFARLIIIAAPGGGLFVYSGTPGPGTLVGSWTSAAGTDPYGNSYPAGLNATAGVLSGLLSVAAQFEQLNPGPLLVYGNVTQTVVVLTGAGNWLAPAGVTTVQAFGIGGGSGRTPGFGGCGAEYAQDNIGVTPGNLYAYSVGAGGVALAGTGGNTTFAGDVITLTAHGGTAAAPGSGSTNTIHFSGGGRGTAVPGGGGAGGGSAGGPISAGNAGHSNVGGIGGPGGAAPMGNIFLTPGPGGNGGNTGLNGSTPAGFGGGAGAPGAGGVAQPGAVGTLVLVYSTAGSVVLTEAVASSAGTDPLTSAAYSRGFYSANPTFGDTSALFGGNLTVTGITSFNVAGANFDVATVGRGLRVAEGLNAKQGTGTLAAGTATVANTSVTASSRILVTGQPGGANRGGLNVTTITAGTSFVVTSTNAADTGNFAYEIFEPG